MSGSATSLQSGFAGAPMIRDKVDDRRIDRGDPSCMDMASLLLDKIVSSWWYGIQLVDHGEPV
jgi:hypothetical protein